METDDLFVDLFNPKTPKLEAIIFAEFDNDIGRVIKYQIPHDVFDKQKFETFSSAIIPSKEMQNRMIKINMYNYKIMGHPIGLTDPKYDREYYMFNMCFVVAQDSQNDSIYEPVVQKLASYLVDLENESAFLSTSKQKDLLPPLMTKIFTELNEKGECVHEVSSLTTIYLKLCPSFHGREPPIVNPFMVPIFTRVPAPKTDEAINKMDVLSQKICPKIDGVRCIKDISKEVKIDPDLVGRCIQNLYFYGYISLLPMFLYSNIYTLDCSKKIRLFLENETMTLQCVKFVALKQDSLPLVNDVCRLYLSLKNGIKFKDWCLRMQPRQLNVDERKFIQFGIFYGFVRKLSIYPVAINPEEGIKIMKLCNGERSLEDLALEYSCSPIELHQNLIENGNFSFIVR